ncbi:hypothetical protein D3C80_1653500 [compost metagenome]
MRVDELRQHRQHEYQCLGVTDVHQKATKDQAQRLANRPHAGLFAHVHRQRAPLFVGQVHQVTDAEPFDDLEGSGGGGEDRADTGSDDGDLHDQADLQAQGVPVTAPETVL